MTLMSSSILFLIAGITIPVAPASMAYRTQVRMKLRTFPTPPKLLSHMKTTPGNHSSTSLHVRFRGQLMNGASGSDRSMSVGSDPPRCLGGLVIIGGVCVSLPFEAPPR